MIAENEKILKNSEHCFLSKKKIFSILIIPLIFFTQILILNEKSILDETYWIQKLDYLKQNLQSKNLSFDISRHAPHPGTLPLMVALAFKPLGFSDTTALKSAELSLLTIFISILFFLAIYFFRSYLLALGRYCFFYF